MKNICKIILLYLCCFLSVELCAFSVSRSKSSRVGVKKKTVYKPCTPAKVSCGNSGYRMKGPVTAKRVRRKKNDDDDAYRNRRNKKEDDIWNPEQYSQNNESRSNYKHPHLGVLSRIHELQKELICNTKLSKDEREKIRKQIIYLSRPLRRTLGRVEKFPYFSEISGMEKVVASLYGKKTTFSVPGMSKEEILLKIQQEQYDRFDEYLSRY